MASKQTIDALKAAYRKHVLLDDFIGWEEMGTILLDALCEEIGNDGYAEFVDEIKKTTKR